jgi:uncharacterized protein (DUF433 family)
MASNVKRLASRIVQSPNVLHGQVVIEGTRVPVQIILGHLSAGDSVAELAEDYGVTREDVLACLAYAAHVVGGKRLKRASKVWKGPA